MESATHHKTEYAKKIVKVIVTTSQVPKYRTELLVTILKDSKSAAQMPHRTLDCNIIFACFL
ncbi:MAG: hypothetical protein SWO11_03955 [Thermodesulfobacteriota bacterium]|nr:hypothetical protein [Thermodesulfobacteriota bacterium]